MRRAPVLDISLPRLRLATRLHACARAGMGLDASRRVCFGLGFQLYGMAGGGDAPTPNAGGDVPFGHTGAGGSIAYYDPACDLSVAVTVNQLSADKAATRALLAVVQAAAPGATRFEDI